MLFSMERQIILFVFSLLSGILIGILFDVYRIIRGFEDVGSIITIIQDVLFWTATALILFVFMMYTNYAYMSFNVFIYILAGLYLYIKLFSFRFRSTLKKFLLALFKFVRVIFFIVSYPIRLCLYKIKIKIKI